MRSKLADNDHGPCLIKELEILNMLSYGPRSEPIKLGSLNVIIGPNGSGKSNLIESIDLLRSTRKDIRETVRRGGGVEEWVWKGNSNGVASVSAVISNPHGSQPLRHTVAFAVENQRFSLVDERIENENSAQGEDSPYFYYRYQSGRPVVNVRGEKRNLIREQVEHDQSILSQRQDPEAYPEITFLSKSYSGIRIYRDWQFGRDTVFRRPQLADMENDILLEDFSNLGLFLNQIRLRPKVKRSIVDGLTDLYEGVRDFEVKIQGGTVQVFFDEGDYTVPATRLSDGSVRYLSLLAMLHDPTPPELICIEEPELGLHPDVITKVAAMLVDAAKRSQIVVTTHSEVLVDALSDNPETVLVCEKNDGQTTLERLSQEYLADWLDRYRLGDLWLKGELGGTRW